QADYDLDGIGDSCDPCNDFPPVITEVADTVYVKFLTNYGFYPEIADPDNTTHTITYTQYPHWCQIRNDSLIGTAPDTAFYEAITVIVEDTCNADTMSFFTQVYLCGDADNDGTGPYVSDLVYLVNYLFKGGPPPPILTAGDVNNDGSILVDDLVYLVNYIFKGGQPPICN
ncbi:MAG: hypothetical protein ABIJ12_08695, partial [bacterium]